MDIQNIIKELDQVYASGDRFAIEEFLMTHIQEAKESGDWSAQGTLQNELIGLYRVLGRFENGRQLFEDTYQLLKDHGLEGSEPYAGTLVNGATLNRAFGKLEEASRLFEDAREIYERELPACDLRLASFYNNFGLLYLDRKMYDKAEELLLRSLQILETIDGSIVEQATCHTTMAMLFMQANHLDRVQKHLDAAEGLFGRIQNQDPHYGSLLAAAAQYKRILGKPREALALYQSALEHLAKYFGKNHSYGIICQSCAILCRELGDPVLTASYQAQADAILKGNH